MRNSRRDDGATFVRDKLHLANGVKPDMPTRNIKLTGRLDAFIEQRVASGLYGNASEIVREALRLLEQREKEQDAKLRALRKAAKAGFDSIDQGEAMELRNARELGDFLDDIAAEVHGAASKGKSRSDAGHGRDRNSATGQRQW